LGGTRVALTKPFAHESLLNPASARACAGLASAPESGSARVEPGLSNSESNALWLRGSSGGSTIWSGLVEHAAHVSNSTSSKVRFLRGFLMSYGLQVRITFT
jgi:hypothetical protein